MPTPAEVLEEASQRAGLSDFGDDWFMGPLGSYLEGLSDDFLEETVDFPAEFQQPPKSPRAQRDRSNR